MAWVTWCHPHGEETGGTEAGLGDSQGETMHGVWDTVSLRHSWDLQEGRRGCPGGKWIQGSRAYEKIGGGRCGLGSQIRMSVKATRMRVEFKEGRFSDGSLGSDQGKAQDTS